jgi:hypothetical protein
MMVTGFLPAAQPPRPATSPVPGSGAAFSATDIRKHPPSSAMAAANNAKVMLAAQHARALRPLPPKSPSGFSMFIEGSRTGEEKAMPRPTVVREPLAPKPQPPSPDTPAAEEVLPSKEDARAVKDRERLRKLEQDVAKLQEQLKKKTSDNAELKDANLRLSSTSETMKNRFEDRIQQLLNDAETKDRHIGDHGKLIEQLRRENEALKADVRSRDDQLLKEQAANAAKHGETEASLRAALASKDAMMAAESQKVSAVSSEMAALRQRLSDAERESHTMRERLNSDLASARDRENALLKQIAALRTQALDAQEQLAQWKQRVTDCNEYVVKVCQPQFSVVKDESLAPLNGKPSAPGEGYVLVPLPLMLEGYALLPPDTKKRIASTYEAQQSSSQQPRKPSLA